MAVLRVAAKTPRFPSKTRDLKQTVLYKYFSVEKSKSWRAPFLELPLVMRQRIYRYTGLVRDCPIDLNSRKPVEEWCERNGIDPEEYWYREQLMVPWDSDNDSDSESRGDEEGVFNADEVYVARYKCPTRNRAQRLRLLHEARDEDENNDDDAMNLLFYEGHDACDQLPIRLLLVCKQVYREVLPLLYGENRSQISLSKWNNLFSLEFLGEVPMSFYQIPYNSITLRSGVLVAAGPDLSYG